MKKQNLITFQPFGLRSIISSDLSILEAARACGVDITSVCGGAGVCDSCRIRIISGSLSKLTPEEEAIFTPVEIENGFRLACQAFPQNDVIIEVPPESISSPQRLQVEGKEPSFEIDPSISILDLQLTSPQLKDLTSDLSRFSKAISEITGNNSLDYDYLFLTQLSDLTREYNWHVQLAMRNSTAFAIFPSSTLSPSPLFLGLAVDIGTTKLAAYLVDLASGNTLAKIGAMNPQIAFGEDVISRIAYANTHPSINDDPPGFSGRKWLQIKVVDAINSMIDEMIAEINSSGLTVSSNQILDSVIVGNTAMHHIFAGLPVSQLGVSPYVPSASEPLELLARDIGLKINPGASIYLPPNIAGYVGADHIAMLVASVFDKDHQNFPKSNSNKIIALDIGTNTEISLITPNEHLCCSCASGPAFEGAHITFGMRAAAGAIERVQISNDIIRMKTINNTPPVGVCGSGILDAISEMRATHIIDHRGAILFGHPSVKSINGHYVFVLVPGENAGHGKDITITRKDVTEIQLAKSAIRTGIDILLDEAGIQATSIDEFIVAGAFGTYIDIQAAVRIGMFPEMPMQRFSQIGNAAGIGAKQMLLSRSKRKHAYDISQNIRYVELSNHKNFSEKFSESLYF